MIGRQHHTVRRLIKRMHIRLEPMKTHDAIGNQLIHLLFVGVLIKAHHIEGDLLAEFCFQRSGRREKLVHAFFLHNAPHKQEAAHAVIPHGNAGILVQIDARTGQHPYLPVGDDLFIQKELRVLLILEKRRLCLAQSAAIHHRHHRRQHRLFKRRAQPLHVGDVRDAFGLAGCAHIDIGLDGIGNDHVRLKLVQHLPVRLQQLHILEGVDAAAVNIRLDAAQPHGLQIVLMPHKGRAENDLVLLHQRLHQLLAEAVEHIGMVGCDQNLHFLFSILCSSPVPPSTTPSPRKAEMAVPKKQRQSKPKLMRCTYSPSRRALSAISSSSRPQICAQPDRPGFTSLAPYLSRWASRSS